MLAEVAEGWKIPVYLIKIGGNIQNKLGSDATDEIWNAAVEKTGGRFFPVADESAIFRAVHEIDQLAVGRIDIRGTRSTGRSSPRSRWPRSRSGRSRWPSG